MQQARIPRALVASALKPESLLAVRSFRVAAGATGAHAKTTTTTQRSIFSQQQRHLDRPREHGWATPAATSYATQARYYHTSHPCSFSSTSQQNPPDNPTNHSLLQQKKAWRQLVKPFLLKCHPDVVAAEARMETGQSLKDTNLKAIQNLNSYLDMVQTMVDSIVRHKVLRWPSVKQLEVEFILLIPDTMVKNKRKHFETPHVMSRRKVELVVPHKELLLVDKTNPNSIRLSGLMKHVLNELCKLLRVAGLEIPHNVREELLQSESRQQRLETQQRQQQSEQGATSTMFDRKDTEDDAQDYSKFSRARYKANRDAFVSRIDWNKVEKMNEKALADQREFEARQEALDRDPGEKRRLVAQILARIKVQRKGRKGKREKIGLLQELVAFRRLSLLFEDCFEELEMNDFSSPWWDRLQIVLTPERPFATSGSALHRRASQQGMDNGFSFTLHSTQDVTLTVPIDFRDDELISELKRNMDDFASLMGDGMEDIFKDGQTPRAYYDDAAIGLQV